MDWLTESTMVRAVLTLREYLVRHDENLKAWLLLRDNVPFMLDQHPDIVRARAEQWVKVQHLYEATVNTDYYANNPETSFEEWNGGGQKVEDAQLVYPRVLFAHERLTFDGATRAVDLSAHDGWMARNLELHFPGLTVDCIDLNPTNTQAAAARGISGTIRTGDFRTLLPEAGTRYDAAFLFETIEHLLNPLLDLRLIGQYTDRLFVSTPMGSVEDGDLPHWAILQPAGHVHAFAPDQFLALLKAVGEVVSFQGGNDKTMFAEVRTA